MPRLVTVIGDIVGSRRLPDRAGAQVAVGEALAAVNEVLDPAQRFEVTVGDEFQGATEHLADAVLAALLIRLSLLPEVDVRCGIGVGDVVVHDAGRTPLLQDGPGWWAARDALDELGLPRSRATRTWYAGPDSGRVNAFLLSRDALIERLSDRGRRLLHGALLGVSQQDLATREDISKSAVSQQFARGVGALRDAHLEFARDSADGTES